MLRNLAARYDNLRKQSRSFLAFEKLAKKWIGKGKAVVDVGCGSGVSFPLLRELVGEEGEVYAIEPNEEMLKEARKNAKKFGVKLFKKRVEELSSLGKKFDVVFSSFLFQLCDVKKAMKELKKSIKPGGLLLFIVPSHRVGISVARDGESRRFRRKFLSGVKKRLKERGIRTKVDFGYVYERGYALGKMLPRNGFKVEYFSEGLGTSAGLGSTCSYYEIPWRSEMALPGVKFEERRKIITASLKDAFAKQPNFKVKRYYVMCVARRI